MGFFSWVGDGLRAAGSFVANHWKEIAVVAVSTVVFGAVLVATGGTAALLAPTLLQLAVAGVAAGAAGQITGDLLDGRVPTVRDVVKSAVIGGVVTVATAGLGRFVPGLSRPLTNQIAQRAVITGAGSAGGAGAQVLSNAIDGRPLLDNVADAAVRGGVTTLLASEGVRLAAPRVVTALNNRNANRPPPARQALPEPLVEEPQPQTRPQTPPQETPPGNVAQPGSAAEQALVAELQQNGVKTRPERVILTGRDQSGRVVFLEKGATKAEGSTRPSGLGHIMEEHAADFARAGIPADQVPAFVMEAATRGRLVGYQGSGTGRPVYEVTWNGQTRTVAVTVGNNGYVVGANPTSSFRPVSVGMTNALGKVGE